MHDGVCRSDLHNMPLARADVNKKTEFVGMRIGWLTANDDPSWTKGKKAEDYMRAMYLSHRDCVVAHRRALEVETQYLLAYVVSNNDRRVFDLEETVATLGFEPQDYAEDYF